MDTFIYKINSYTFNVYHIYLNADMTTEKIKDSGSQGDSLQSFNGGMILWMHAQCIVTSWSMTWGSCRRTPFCKAIQILNFLLHLGSFFMLFLASKDLLFEWRISSGINSWKSSNGFEYNAERRPTHHVPHSEHTSADPVCQMNAFIVNIWYAYRYSFNYFTFIPQFELVLNKYKALLFREWTHLGLFPVLNSQWWPFVRVRVSAKKVTSHHSS